MATTLTVTIEVERQAGMNAGRSAIVDALRELLDGEQLDVEFARADGDVTYSEYEVTAVEAA